ncbi:MAG: hypothetical protein IJ600_07415 [Lachnospiraceae bacterium]|nr:hypothetical protein [Lachnospiraceae bacterium]
MSNITLNLTEDQTKDLLFVLRLRAREIMSYISDLGDSDFAVEYKREFSSLNEIYSDLQSKLRETRGF